MRSISALRETGLPPARETQSTSLEQEEDAADETETCERGRDPQEGGEEAGDTRVRAGCASISLIFLVSILFHKQRVMGIRNLPGK